jgi:uncharacterized membrane protein
VYQHLQTFVRKNLFCDLDKVPTGETKVRALIAFAMLMWFWILFVIPLFLMLDGDEYRAILVVGIGLVLVAIAISGVKILDTPAR